MNHRGGGDDGSKRDPLAIAYTCVPCRDPIHQPRRQWRCCGTIKRPPWVIELAKESDDGNGREDPARNEVKLRTSVEIDDRRRYEEWFSRWIRHLWRWVGTSPTQILDERRNETVELRDGSSFRAMPNQTDISTASNWPTLSLSSNYCLKILNQLQDVGPHPGNTCNQTADYTRRDHTG
ncbi:hypothetical protein BDM02DRAFT_3263954 [Thelephora ganbajun]|uniref:Uncharacterized protein n=1 Tax=Thelephora ganbajun TaxID=370292 RepID=A0ACB6Z2U8_THEGA|nr:hypothetical protein BDM02DRAFT_3263954 [Thelephora ganbajun]